MKTLIKTFCKRTGVPLYFLKNSFFEMKMLFLRGYGWLPMQRLKIKKIKKQPCIHLNFGCGQTHYPEWIGIDSFFAKHVNLVLDLRRKLPFEKNSIDYCYSEHFLEHLYPQEGLQHLQEVHRILKPKGVYRIVVPAALRFAEKYLAKDNDFFKLAFPWVEHPIDALYSIVNWHGEHKNIFDYDHLYRLSKQAGFHAIRESSVNASPVATLRIDKDSAQRVAESLYVELIKE